MENMWAAGKDSDDRTAWILEASCCPVKSPMTSSEFNDAPSRASKANCREGDGARSKRRRGFMNASRLLELAVHGCLLRPYTHHRSASAYEALVTVLSVSCSSLSRALSLFLSRARMLVSSETVFWDDGCTTRAAREAIRAYPKASLPAVSILQLCRALWAWNSPVSIQALSVLGLSRQTAGRLGYRMRLTTLCG